MDKKELKKMEKTLKEAGYSKEQIKQLTEPAMEVLGEVEKNQVDEGDKEELVHMTIGVLNQFLDGSLPDDAYKNRL